MTRRNKVILFGRIRVGFTCAGHGDPRALLTEHRHYSQAHGYYIFHIFTLIITESLDNI